MSIDETVTARIFSQLDAGVVPWRKTWTTGLPKSLTTGKEYRGANILILGMASFSSRYGVTYREAQRLGGQVRRGERASPVVFRLGGRGDPACLETRPRRRSPPHRERLAPPQT